MLFYTYFQPLIKSTACVSNKAFGFSLRGSSVVAGFSYSNIGKQTSLLIMGTLEITPGAGLAVNNRFSTHLNPVGFNFTLLSQFLW